MPWVSPLISLSLLPPLASVSWMSCSAAPTSRRISRASVCGTWGRAALSVSSWSPTLTQVGPFLAMIPHQPGDGASLPAPETSLSTKKPHKN